MLLRKACRFKGEDFCVVVGSNRIFVGGDGAQLLLAFAAQKDQNEAFFTVELVVDGIHKTTTIMGAVAGIDIDVFADEATRAVIAAAALARRYLELTVLTGEPVVIMDKSTHSRFAPPAK